MRYSKFLIPFILLFLLAACNDEATSPQTGIVSVLVVDVNGTTPVPNEEIIIMPDSLIKSTNKNGICSFELKPGNYIVKAKLPGPGPGLRTFNESVEVKSGETIKVKFEACMACL